MNLAIDQIVLKTNVPFVVTGFKMDPNYVHGRLLFSSEDPVFILYVSKLVVTNLTLSDLANITSTEQFYTTYPEYLL